VTDSLERLWTSFLNSDGFRRFAKRGLGSIVFRSQAYRAVNLARRYVTFYYRWRQEPAFFQEVRTFCIFVGNNKSGSSLIGSLLDAHPDMILADEADALQYVPAGFSRDQIYHLLLKVSRREAMKGRVTARRLTPYSFLVPSQWQGRYRRLRVIGDTTTGTATQRIARDPRLLQRLQQVMGEVNVKFIQVIRNPYDPISVSIVRGQRSFENAIGHYFANCETLTEMRRRLGPSELLAVRYEHFVQQPEAHLVKLCRFLEVEADDDYLKACLRILHKSPDRSRHLVPWEAGWIDVVKRHIDRFDFLEGYSFEA
jgi:hypothetical protein